MFHALPETPSLEEQLLRALYEGPASAQQCALELSPFARPSARRLFAITRLLEDLVAHAHAEIHPGAGPLRYALTPAGSARLADLVE